MSFDVVIAVGPRHVNTSITVVRHLKMNKIGNGRYFFVTRPELFVGVVVPDQVQIVDESKIVAGLSFSSIKRYFEDRGIESDRHGWYLKQFLVFAIGLTEIVGDNYLVWDADTYALTNLPFIDEAGRQIFDVKSEYNKAYFDNIERLFALNKQVDRSFITEHMIFRKLIVRQMIAEIEMRFKEKFWFFSVLDHVDDSYLHGPGFSEYETYGTYVSAHFTNDYVLREVPSVRYESPIFGRDLSDMAVFYLSHRYAWVTQEFHKKVSLWVTFKAKLKMISFVIGRLGTYLNRNR